MNNHVICVEQKNVKAPSSQRREHPIIKNTTLQFPFEIHKPLIKALDVTIMEVTSRPATSCPPDQKCRGLLTALPSPNNVAIEAIHFDRGTLAAPSESTQREILREGLLEYLLQGIGASSSGTDCFQSTQEVTLPVTASSIGSPSTRAEESSSLGSSVG